MVSLQDEWNISEIWTLPKYKHSVWNSGVYTSITDFIWPRILFQQPGEVITSLNLKSFHWVMIARFSIFISIKNSWSNFVILRYSTVERAEDTKYMKHYSKLVPIFTLPYSAAYSIRVLIKKDPGSKGGYYKIKIIWFS